VRGKEGGAQVLTDKEAGALESKSRYKQQMHFTVKRDGYQQNVKSQGRLITWKTIYIQSV
jgi:hypothetical protein